MLAKVLHAHGALGVERHGFGQHVLGEEHVELARAEWAHLAEHDVLRDAAHVVDLGVRRGLHEDLHALLKGAAHEWARVIAVHAVPRDRHQVALRKRRDRGAEITKGVSSYPAPHTAPI